METVNVLDQMAEYDFNAPIDVEMIFEDSDDDNDSSTQNGLSEPEYIKDNNNNKPVSLQKCGTKCNKHKKKTKINHRGLNNVLLNLNNNNRILNEKPIEEIRENNAENDLNNSNNAKSNNNSINVGHDPNQSQSNASLHTLILNGKDAVNDESDLPSPHQVYHQHEPITTFVEDLLNKLSEHIVLIMQSFYHYGVRNPNQDKKKREEIFRFIQSHFFELSYTTVESIVLPQEQNNTFINQFLDNTVLIANRKCSRWKCHKGHVRPFFRQLVRWTKHRREQIKRNHLHSSSNKNTTLKQQLIRPVLSLDTPHSETVANSNVATPRTQNNLCIFTSGTPGHEISINIDADTLIHLNQQLNTAERNGNQNNNAPSTEATIRNTPAARPTYGNVAHNIQKNNSLNRRPPPPYYINHYSKIPPHRPPQYNTKNFNSNRINHGNMGQPLQNHHNLGQPHQNHQNIGQPIYNYQTQVQYINRRQISPPHNDSLNYLLYDNPNNNIPLHETQIEHQVTSSPVISNVSFNPRTHILNVRCYMCGKNTSTPCDPHNIPCRQTYCSYLCQELDSQCYKPTWGTT